MTPSNAAYFALPIAQGTHFNSYLGMSYVCTDGVYVSDGVRPTYMVWLLTFTFQCEDCNMTWIHII